MIEIKEGHDQSSYFWIMPVKFDYNNYKKYSDYWDAVSEFREKEISIEETDVDSFLYYFFHKYFDETLEANVKRDEIRNKAGECTKGPAIFECYLDHNFYSFDAMQEIVQDIKDKIELIKNDYNNIELGELKEKFDWLADLEIDTKNMTKAELYNYAEEHKSSIIDFYQRFIKYIDDMIKEGEKHGYDLISIMGP